MSVESLGSVVPAPVQSATSSSPSIERQEKTERIAKNVQADAQVEDTKEVDKVELQDAVQKLNDFTSNNTQRDLTFAIDEDTKEMVVTVRDSRTQEVIRQMPTEEALAVAKQIESMLGLILNDKA
ncbi:MAG: flagellar protein FlaG [Moritella sp.]|uniref:flagellar protein FlaG n=1 Tax=Moritella sp. TaxID=78556 RepID=UPI001D8DDEB1|nr:flagellar protein FlaG [Moritella sp.]NQZ51874.1 flagellar protein FlaG [Moritella sp.]